MGTHPIFESDFDCLTDMADYQGLIRTCQIKRKKKEEFDFKLKYDKERKGNVVTSVVEKGAAGRAGIAAGDRIIIIDGKNVEQMSHKDLVGVIRALKKESKFEVLGAEVDPVNPERDAQAATKGEQIFNIHKESGSYGFSLITNPGSGENGFEHCIKDVKENGPADKAGVKNQMMLVAMNGHDCVSMKHQAVVSLVKSGGKNCIMRCKLAVAATEKEEEKPDFSRNVSIHQARSQKIFGTVKSFKVNPNARPKVPLYDEQPTEPVPAPVVAPVPVTPAPAQPAKAARAPRGSSIASLMNRFQQNGQVLTGGQMPSAGVPERTEGVKIVEPVQAKPVQPAANPAAPQINLAQINAAAAQRQPAPQMQPQFQQPAQQPQQFQQFGGYQQPYQPYQQPFYGYGQPQMAAGQPFAQPQFMQQPYGQPQVPFGQPFVPPQQQFQQPPQTQQQQQQQPQFR